MAGWRLGFVCGNAQMVNALARIKSYLDYGVFQPIQIAGIVALEGDQKCVAEIVELHRKRRDVLVDGLNKIGWNVREAQGHHVRVGAHPRGVPGHGLARVLQAAHPGGQGGGLARASASASTARATSASPSSRTSSGSGRPCAASRHLSPLSRPGATRAPRERVTHRPARARHRRRRRGEDPPDHGAEMLQERAGCAARARPPSPTPTSSRPREGLDLARAAADRRRRRGSSPTRVHVVIELVGGLEPARTFILRALAAGKHVVTANKALLAHHGAELFEEARRRGVMLGFEAAVAGGIPAHPRGQGRPRRQPHRCRFRHRQRHLQLHPDQDDRRGARLLAWSSRKRRPTATPRPIRRSTSRGSTRPTSCRSWPRSPSAPASTSRTSTPRASPRVTAAGHRLRARARLPDQAPRHRQGDGDGALEARVHPTMIPAASPLAAVSGVVQRASSSPATPSAT